MQPLKRPAKLTLLDGTSIVEMPGTTLEMGVSAVTLYRIIVNKTRRYLFMTQTTTYKLPSKTIPWHQIKEIDWGYQAPGIPVPVRKVPAAGGRP